MYKRNPKPAKQLEYALERGIPFVIFIGPQEIEEGKIKIKDLKGETEHSYPAEIIKDRDFLMSLVNGAT